MCMFVKMCLQTSFSCYGISRKRFERTSIFHTLRFAKLTYFSVGLDFLLLVQNSLFGSAIPRCVPSPFCSFFAWSPFNFPLHEVAHELGLGSGGAPAANTLCLNLEPTQETRLVVAIITFSLHKVGKFFWVL